MVERFIVANDKGMKALPKVLQKHKKHFNVYSYCPTNKSTCFTLGKDLKPDSDWGKYLGPYMRVIVVNKDYDRRVEAAIRKVLGWEPLEQSGSPSCIPEKGTDNE